MLLEPTIANEMLSYVLKKKKNEIRIYNIHAINGICVVDITYTCFMFVDLNMASPRAVRYKIRIPLTLVSKH